METKQYCSPVSNLPLPAGWAAFASKSRGTTYFQNTKTGATTWDFPEEEAKKADEEKKAVEAQQKEEAERAFAMQKQDTSADVNALIFSNRSYMKKRAEELVKADHKEDNMQLTKNSPVEKTEDLPAGWKMEISSKGRTYYRNLATSDTQFDYPHIPAGWERHFSSTNKHYYYKHKSSGHLQYAYPFATPQSAKRPSPVEGPTSKRIAHAATESKKNPLSSNTECRGPRMGIRQRDGQALTPSPSSTNVPTASPEEETSPPGNANVNPLVDESVDDDDAEAAVELLAVPDDAEATAEVPTESDDEDWPAE